MLRHTPICWSTIRKTTPSFAPHATSTSGTPEHLLRRNSHAYHSKKGTTAATNCDHACGARGFGTGVASRSACGQEEEKGPAGGNRRQNQDYRLFEHRLA